jgi:bifunctional non-homologous end joining protein LigD
MATIPKQRRTLPGFVEPMLARLVPAFDSDQHFYEVKWDGFRAMAIVEKSGLRLVGRRQTDFTARFPELSGLAELPSGTMLDGEIVLFRAGRPDFQTLLGRERRWSASSRPTVAKSAAPVTFVAFDLLYDRFASVLNEPLLLRRRRLEGLLARRSCERVRLSEGRVGQGLELFREVNRLGLEGVVAKHVESRYESGERSGSWLKFKQRQSVICAIIGYLPSSTGGLKSLLLAAEVDGVIRFVGQVGSGISPSDHRRLLSRFSDLQATRAPVMAKISGARWLRPELFCRVSFMEWTNTGKLRVPVFEALLDAMRYEDGS